MNIKIDVKQEDTNIEVTVQGEIDAYTAPKLRETLFPLVDQEGVRMTVDLSGVGYMDSTGLGVFVGLFKNIRAREGDFRIIGMSDRLKRLFDITGLADIIHITSDIKGGL
ncbi:anti-sigma factor antagonist [Bacillus testis]|uniref:anti-sigma factor antagonist n=1 Tax=Bacillus testis TaxID=1622072 RepID=UPI00067F11E3|nr:anti-sigma factor antagonist [Bacillus testis]